jgi:hypothetical protein
VSKLKVLVRKPAAVVVLLVALGVTAHASSIVLFTSLDVFQSQAGVPDLAFNFNSIPDSIDRLSAMNFGDFRVGGDFTIERGTLNFAGGTGATFNFASNVFAFGANFDTLGGGLINFSVGAQSLLFNFAAAPLTSGFLGFATDFPFQSFNISFVPLNRSTSPAFVIDNVIATTVPEPSTLILLLAGAGLTALARRRKPSAGSDTAGQPGGPSDLS